MIDEEKWITAAKTAHDVSLALELENIKSADIGDGILIYNPEQETEHIKMDIPDEFVLSQ